MTTPTNHEHSKHQHNHIDPDLERDPHEPHGARNPTDRGTLAEGVDLPRVSPGVSGGANLTAK